MYSRQPSTCRTNPSALASATSPARNAASASPRRRRAGAAGPRFSGTESNEWAIGQSSCSIASSCGPKCGRRNSTKCASARRASPAVTANQRGPSRPTVGQVEGVEVGAHLLVDLVLRRLPRRDEAERLLAFRRGLAVLVVEVPLPADGLAALHEHVEAAALGPVEVLHPEGLAVAGPRGELRARQREGGRRQDVGDQPLRPQLLDEAQRGVRGRFVDDDGAPDPRQRLPVGVRAQVGGAVAELGGEVAHPGEHEVQLLPVEPLAAQRRGSTRRARPPARGARRCRARAGRAGRRRATAARWSCAQCRGAARPPATRRRRPRTSVFLRAQDVRPTVRRRGPA